MTWEGYQDEISGSASRLRCRCAFPIRYQLPLLNHLFPWPHRAWASKTTTFALQSDLKCATSPPHLSVIIIYPQPCAQLLNSPHPSIYFENSPTRKRGADRPLQSANRGPPVFLAASASLPLLACGWINVSYLGWDGNPLYFVCRETELGQR